MRDALRCLASLPEEQRQVLLLVTVEGFAYVDVAGILGIPVGTVMSRLSRARDKLRDFVEGKEQPMLRTVK
jgi:RNA polymerase sigma-70 factor (ECF subfamily)